MMDLMSSAMTSLAGGFASALTPLNLLWALAGCFIGTAIGVLPGIGPALTVAMLLPLTAKVEPASALILFAGIYYGAMFGGSTTSILMNTPGESATMVSISDCGDWFVRSRHDCHDFAFFRSASGSTSSAKFWSC
jgi:TctA family transporter